MPSNHHTNVSDRSGISELKQTAVVASEGGGFGGGCC